MNTTGAFRIYRNGKLLQKYSKQQDALKAIHDIKNTKSTIRVLASSHEIIFVNFAYYFDQFQIYASRGKAKISLLYTRDFDYIKEIIIKYYNGQAEWISAEGWKQNRKLTRPPLSQKDWRFLRLSIFPVLIFPAAVYFSRSEFLLFFPFLLLNLRAVVRKTLFLRDDRRWKLKEIRRRTTIFSGVYSFCTGISLAFAPRDFDLWLLWGFLSFALIFFGSMDLISTYSFLRNYPFLRVAKLREPYQNKVLVWIMILINLSFTGLWCAEWYLYSPPDWFARALR